MNEPCVWCDRCHTWHWGHPFDIEFIYLKASYKLAEAFDIYLEERIREWINE